MNTYTVITYAWLVAGAVWLLSSLTAKPTVRRQSLVSRLVQMMIVGAGILLLCDKGLRVGPLALRLVPASSAASYAALLLTLGGVGLALWARFFLGRNWSGTVTVKRDHQLIRGGPYRFVRHPIYSGFLIAMVGSAIDLGHLGGFIGVLLVVVGFRLKSLTEEKFMMEQFGSEYVEYKDRVKALIPFVW